MASTAKGVANGLATLNSSAKVPTAQLPAGVATITAQGVAVADAAAFTSAAATGGDAPTEAEYNALRTDALAVRTTLNALLASLRTAGVIAT
jgi:hypothetical protein